MSSLNLDQRVSVSDAIPIVVAMLRAGIAPYLQGPPGIGKTSLIRDVAAIMGNGEPLPVHWVYASTLSTIDAYGVPYIDHGEIDKLGVKSTHYAVNAIWPNEGPGILALDEYGQAPQDVKALLANLFHPEQRGFASYKLPDGMHVVATGNRVGDKAATSRLPSQTVNRVGVIQVKSCHRSWLGWAGTHDINQDVMAFVAQAPDYLNDFDADNYTADQPYASERAWVAVSRFLEMNPDLSETTTHFAVSGIVGSAASIEFMQRRRLGREIPSYGDIVSGKADAWQPPSMAHALCVATMIARRGTRTDARKCFDYVERLAHEAQAVFVILAHTMKAELVSSSEFGLWIEKNHLMLA